MPPSTMDLEPIYCAEQISVPPDLADILKAYTKEVVRRQPEDVYEFSAMYAHALDHHPIQLYQRT
jgi:hypothetical protein